MLGWIFSSRLFWIRRLWLVYPWIKLFAPTTRTFYEEIGSLFKLSCVLANELGWGSIRPWWIISDGWSIFSLWLYMVPYAYYASSLGQFYVALRLDKIIDRLRVPNVSYITHLGLSLLLRLFFLSFFAAWIKFFGHRYCAKRGCFSVEEASESGTKVSVLASLITLIVFIIGFMTDMLLRCEAGTVFFLRQLLRLIFEFRFCYSKDVTWSVCNELLDSALAFFVLMNEIVLFRSSLCPKSFLSNSERPSFSKPP